jgi:hypothetical protein
LSVQEVRAESFSRFIFGTGPAEFYLKGFQRKIGSFPHAKSVLATSGYESCLNAGAATFGLLGPAPQYDAHVENVGPAVLFALAGLHPDVLLPQLSAVFGHYGLSLLSLHSFHSYDLNSVVL